MKYRLNPGSFDKIRLRLPRKKEVLHDDFQTILNNYRKHYGYEKGTELFNKWIEAYNLDTSKPYQNQHQLITECINGLCESWKWAKPYIKKYKEDSEAIYYKVLALTGNLSMNKNDYRDLEELQRNASSLSYRPINLNHDHNLMLPFDENRVDISAYEDEGVEAIMRIANNATHPLTGRDINAMIKDGDILHVSVEGKPRSIEVINGITKPSGYTFLGLALLEKNVTLPGDPLTYLEPLTRGR